MSDEGKDAVEVATALFDEGFGDAFEPADHGDEAFKSAWSVLRNRIASLERELAEVYAAERRYRSVIHEQQKHIAELQTKLHARTGEWAGDAIRVERQDDLIIELREEIEGLKRVLCCRDDEIGKRGIRILDIERERDELKKLNESTYCAYCGERFELSAEDNIERVGSHIATCPKHPMRAIERERDELKANVKAKDDYDRFWGLRLEDVKRKRDELKARIEGARRFMLSRRKRDGEISWATNLAAQDPEAWEDVEVHAVPVIEPIEAKDRESIEAEERKEDGKDGK